MNLLLPISTIKHNHKVLRLSVTYLAGSIRELAHERFIKGLSTSKKQYGVDLV